jgi:nicotinamidase/pyrazinamidase
MSKETRVEALVVIDMLNDFVRPGAPLEVPAARDIIPCIRRRIARAREERSPVIYVCDAHAPEDPEFEAWGRHAVRGTEGAEVVSELAPAPGDDVVQKTTLSAFFKTGLDGVLEKHGVTAVVLSGVLTNICVYYVAVEAAVRGYEVVVPRDCVAAQSDEEHEFALGQMKKILKTRIE